MHEPRRIVDPKLDAGLRVAEMQMAGTLTRENFLPLLEQYLRHDPSPDGLAGFLMRIPEDWYAPYLAAKQIKGS